MTAKYPSEVTTFDVPGLSRKGKDALAKILREMQEEIVAIQTELGIDPAGAFTDVDARFDDIESDVDTIEGYYITKNMAEYNTNTAQSMSDSAWTVVNFEDKVHDPQSAVTVGAGWKFEPPINGLYLITARATLASSNTWGVGEQARLGLFKNASEHIIYIGKSY